MVLTYPYKQCLLCLQFLAVRTLRALGEVTETSNNFMQQIHIPTSVCKITKLPYDVSTF